MSWLVSKRVRTALVLSMAAGVAMAIITLPAHAARVEGAETTLRLGSRGCSMTSVRRYPWRGASSPITGQHPAEAGIVNVRPAPTSRCTPSVPRPLSTRGRYRVDAGAMFATHVAVTVPVQGDLADDLRSQRTRVDRAEAGAGLDHGDAFALGAIADRTVEVVHPPDQCSPRSRWIVREDADEVRISHVRRAGLAGCYLSLSLVQSATMLTLDAPLAGRTLVLELAPVPRSWYAGSCGAYGQALDAASDARAQLEEDPSERNVTSLRRRLGESAAALRADRPGGYGRYPAAAPAEQLSGVAPVLGAQLGLLSTALRDGRPLRGTPAAEDGLRDFFDAVGLDVEEPCEPPARQAPAPHSSAPAVFVVTDAVVDADVTLLDAGGKVTRNLDLGWDVAAISVCRGGRTIVTAHEVAGGVWAIRFSSLRSGRLGPLVPVASESSSGRASVHAVRCINGERREAAVAVATGRQREGSFSPVEELDLLVATETAEPRVIGRAYGRTVEFTDRWAYVLGDENRLDRILLAGGAMERGPRLAPPRYGSSWSVSPDGDTVAAVGPEVTLVDVSGTRMGAARRVSGSFGTRVPEGRGSWHPDGTFRYLRPPGRGDRGWQHLRITVDGTISPAAPRLLAARVDPLLVHGGDLYGVSDGGTLGPQVILRADPDGTWRRVFAPPTGSLGSVALVTPASERSSLIPDPFAWLREKVAWLLRN